MLTYIPPHQRPVPLTREKPWLLIVLCTLWLLPGLIGRQPLKPDEIISADIIKHYLSGASWLIPHVGNEAFIAHMPLFYWFAALIAKLFSPLHLALHDAARLSTGLLMALSLWLCGLSGRELIGLRHGRSVVLILVGCLGLLLPGHRLSIDSSLLLSFSLAYYALALAPRLPIHGGLMLGIALSMAALSADNLLYPLSIVLIALLLPCFAYWKNKRYISTLLIALVIAIPLGLLWPLQLRAKAPELFELWWQHYVLNALSIHEAWLQRFIYYLKLLSWFTWPALPLAAINLWIQRDRLNSPVFQLALLSLAVLSSALLLSPTAEIGQVLALLLPLAMIGAAGLDHLRRGVAACLNWFGIIIFGLLALALWLIWGALYFDAPARLAARLQQLSPSFHADFSLGTTLLALMLTVIWLWAVSRQRSMGRQAVTNWAAGVTLCWSLLLLFGSEWIDARNSYQAFSEQLQQALPQHGCIYREGLGLNQRAMLHYYLSLSTTTHHTHCNWMLARASYNHLPSPSGWKLVWQGSRPNDISERFYLFQRTNATQ